MGPKGFTRLFHESDLRPGMPGPDGARHVNGGQYREIVPLARLVMAHGWEDAAGRLGEERLVTITFAAVDGGTLMRFHQAGFSEAENRDGHRRGWTEAFDMPAENLARLAAAWARRGLSPARPRPERGRGPPS